MVTRRELLKILGLVPGLALIKKLPAMAELPVKATANNTQVSVYRSVDGTPAENMEKVISLAGGIDAYIGKNDIVVIKPNVQRWNQAAPNMGALYTLVKLIMDRSDGFSGEVILAENVHRGSQPWLSAGWSHSFERNKSILGVKNYNELTKRLKQEFGDRYSTVHLVNVEYGAKRVYGPEDGPGYVFCDGTGGVPKIAFGNGTSGDDFRETIMTYPIFQTDRGTIVDFKNGIWKNGNYDNTTLKFINLAALNHHSTYCGITSLIKNYLGVSDLSGGPDPFNDGKLTEKYYNFHSFPFNKWSPGPQPGMIGAEIGVFLDTIRKADLHVVTAEWIGLADRIQPPVTRTRAVMASPDPVALDYHCAKYLLYSNSRIRFHNPDDPNSPTHQYIKACAEHGGGLFDESKVAMVSYDHQSGRMQKDREAPIVGKTTWGASPKAVGKYLLMRYGAFLL